METPLTTITTNTLLILGKTGRLFRIDPMYVVVNTDLVMELSCKEWKKLLEYHLRWGAGCVLGKKPMSPDHVVVIEYESGETRIMSWFVRFQFETGVPGVSAGHNFLWQMPHAAVMQLSIAIIENKRIFNLEGNSMHDLVERYSPTSQQFIPEDLVRRNICTEILANKQFPVQVPLLCLHPSNTFGYPTSDKYYDKYYDRPTLARHSTILLGNSKEPKTTFNLTTAPDDVRLHILEVAIQDLIDAPDKRDLTSLLALRSVSKEFQAVVEKSCGTWARTSFEKMDRALCSGSVSAIRSIGQHFLKAGICASDAYASWTQRQWDKQSEMPVSPITFDTYLCWRRGFASEKKFARREELDPPPKWYFQMSQKRLLRLKLGM
jgi:hypothetical protein